MLPTRFLTTYEIICTDNHITDFVKAGSNF